MPREEFLDPEWRAEAYRNAPLPFGLEQTISQPLVVASMAEALELEPADRVLEIGTGSGYAAAVLSQLAAEVFTVERHPELAATAEQRLRDLGYTNVRVRHGDGTRDWPEYAPFDAIVAAAAAPSVPRPLCEQLAVGARLVIPVGPLGGDQRLLRLTRRDDGSIDEEDLGGVRFVPLVGAAEESL